MEGSKNDLYGIFEGLVQKYAECEGQVNECLAELKSEHIEKVNFSDQKHIIMQQMNTAQNKFTIATIGEFSAGKSTILNTLLNLSGEAQISSQFQKDTAKAIRIMKKEQNQDFDAEIIFREDSDYTNEQLSWEQAKKYTSHIALAENPKLKRKSEQIYEVRYYLDLDILDNCNFLDLPGLGIDPKDDRLTIEKSNECDAVFWIISNTQEVTKDTISNLQIIKHKMVPIINVWYNPDTGEETGDFTFNEMKESLITNFNAYLGDNQIMKYCAKAIEVALERVADDEDMEDAFEDNEDDIWGYDGMQERLHDLIYGEGVDLEEEKKTRMIENVLEACDYMNQKLDGTIEEIKKVKDKLNTEKRSNKLTKLKITTAYTTNQLELKMVASNTVDEIISKINEACELFIDAKMSSAKISVALKSITKSGKNKLEKEYRDEYIAKYLEIDDWDKGNTWLNAVMSEYREDLTSIFDNEYAKAGLDLEDMEGCIDKDVVLDLKFFDAIGENMSITFEQQIKENLPIIISGILIYIPGHHIIDLLLMFCALSRKHTGEGENKLEKRVEQTKRRARLSVSFQRHKLMDSFMKLGRDFNTSYKKNLIKKLKLKNDSIDKLVNAAEKIFSVQENLDEYYNGCRESLRGINGGE
ncbi:MAG: dynamin family protein [Lachnospiraceae bacterium]|nr:dynamin family protein [Lachnospiraceae bacterium]